MIHKIILSLSHVIPSMEYSEVELFTLAAEKLNSVNTQ